MKYEDILLAIHWWCVERPRLKALQQDLTSLLPMVFRTLYSLWIISKEKSTPWSPARPWDRVVESGANAISFDIRLSPKQYVLFRAMLSLVGDVYHLLEPLKERDLLELTDPIRQLHASADVFREARNFFTHLNERLTCCDSAGIRKHGISGPDQSPFGATYTPQAKGHVYALLIGEEFHFTTGGKMLVVDLSMRSLDPLFRGGRDIYREVTSHRIHARTYNGPDEIFP